MKGDPTVPPPDPGSPPDPILTFSPDGTCHLWFGDMNQAFREAICPKCGKTINWAMDMYSVEPGPHPRRLCHARCIWKPNAFRRQAEAAATTYMSDKPTPLPAFDPDGPLRDEIAETIADAAAEHGTHDHVGQAYAVLRVLRDHEREGGGPQ
jgi:hypothetical protein